MQAGKKPTGNKPTGAHWECVKRESGRDAPVPFNPATDGDSEPYNPDAAAAVSAYWNSAVIKRGRGREAPDAEHAG